MNILTSETDSALKVLSDDKIKLELSLGLNVSRQYYYLIYDLFDNEIGHCGIRLENNEQNLYLGNIEYEIYPEYRGHNYAERATRLLSQIAIYYGVDKITITADPDNLPSNKTIKNLGARFIEVRRVPEQAILYRTSKEVNAYEWKIERETKNDRHKIN